MTEQAPVYTVQVFHQPALSPDSGQYVAVVNKDGKPVKYCFGYATEAEALRAAAAYIANPTEPRPTLVVDASDGYRPGSAWVQRIEDEAWRDM